MTHHFTARGAWVEHLPNKAFAGQAQGKGSLPAVGSIVLAGQEVGWDELTKVLSELSQSGLAQGLHRTAAQGGEPRPESGKVRSFHVERHIYRPIDTRATLFFMKMQKESWQANYDSLKARLGRVGWISEGYAQDRGPGAGGPCYQWTKGQR